MSDVEHVDQPARERAELLRAGADAAVDRGALGAGELARHAADRRRRRCRTRRRDGLGREVARRARSTSSSRRRARRAAPGRPGPRRTARARARTGSARRCPGRMKRARRPPRRSGCGAGRPRRRCPPRSRIAAQPPAHVGRGQQAAVRRERVGAQHQQVVGAVDVGDRDRVSGRRTSARRRRAWASGRPCVAREDVLRAERLQRAPGRRAARRGCGRSGCRGRRATASRPCSRGSACRRRSISANASSQDDLARSPSPVRDQRRAEPVRVLVQRASSAVPFGQMKPWLKTSSSSPRIARHLGRPRASARARRSPRTAGRSGRRCAT